MCENTFELNARNSAPGLNKIKSFQHSLFLLFFSSPKDEKIQRRSSATEWRILLIISFFSLSRLTIEEARINYRALGEFINFVISIPLDYNSRRFVSKILHLNFWNTFERESFQIGQKTQWMCNKWRDLYKWRDHAGWGLIRSYDLLER